VLPIPDVPKPGYLETITDPTFGSTVTRVTGDPGTAMQGINGTWNAVARHQYSKVPAWNADQSLLFLGRNDGFPSTVFLDGDSYEPVFGRNAHVLPGSEMRWHPTQPDQMVYVNGNTLGSWNVRTQATQPLETFAGYSDFTIGPFEGNVSNDGRMIAIQAKKNGQNVVFAYDMVDRVKHADISLDQVGLDWASISASGRYLVVNGRFNGNNRFNGLDQTQVYELDGTEVGDLWEEYGRPSHYDLAVDENGDDVAVGVSKSNADDGRVVKRRLRDGQLTVLTDGGYATHTSTRNIDRPGWAYVTYDYEGPNYPPYYGEIVAVKLDGSMTLERIAHMHAEVGSYLTQPQAVVSPDGKRVLWASNWDQADGPIGAFVAERVVPEPTGLTAVVGIGVLLASRRASPAIRQSK
jgi:hypothetical protein